MADFLKLKKSNCKNCYKCIRHCPVKAIRFSGNQAHIVENECILCGRCYVVCPQNAREIPDSIETVRTMLTGKEKLYASVAPSFVAQFPGVGIEGLRAAIKQLGFVDAEETAIGATIVKREYERILAEGKQDVLISSCCHSVNLLIQKYFPAELPFLADVISPMEAHAKDIKRRHPDAKVVFIGPCIAKKDEAETYKNVDVVMTFSELAAWLDKREIPVVPSPDANENSKTRIFPTTGGVISSMDCRPAGYKYLAVDGVENCIAALRDVEAGKLSKCFLELSACEGGCLGGPVLKKDGISAIRSYFDVNEYAGEKDFDVPQPDMASLRKRFEYLERNVKMPSESEIMDIMRQMGKMKPSDELNCGSCGYDTCRDKAIAIYQGKAEVSMCLPYLKDRAENFSDTIINHTPNGIFVLNDKLEVQQINRAALRMMNISRESDVLGEPVVRIMDPKIFMEVKSAGRGVSGMNMYLAEYDRYVEMSIIYDRELHVIIAIMRDITAEETEKERKEEVNRQTVDIADKVIQKQMRIVQEIASLLGETAAETKIALTKLKESIADE